MIVNLKTYAEYKESGLPWLGQVPGHWGVRRMKLLLREVDSRSTSGKEQLLRVSQYTGVTQRKSVDGVNGPDTRASSLVGYKRVMPSDLVINIMLAWNGSMGVSRYDGIASPAYCVYRFKPGAMPWYYHELLRLPLYKGRIKTASTGVVESRLRLYSDDLGRIEVIQPPLAEQAAIVRFLGWANGRLDQAIRAKRKVIALLVEQKQAIIHRAVTRGLDPSVPLKPSGIPWLGDIPQHWEVRRVKQATSILRGKFSHRPRNDASLYDGPYPFIQTGVVAQASRFITSYSQTLNEKGLAVSKLFPSGTLVMTIAANIGEVAVLTFDACFPDSIVGFVPQASADRDYLYMVFVCMKPELLREAPVNTQGNLNVERIGAMGIPFPPLGEQGNIAKHVEQDTAEFDTAISRLEREIELLREYRTRLVADVVTGKLDVREAAVRLPAEIRSESADDDIELNPDPDAIDEEATP
ncbi:MAG: restriction endonuclease subunit S [Thiobacillus sp.]